jgi:hypothetical protein
MAFPQVTLWADEQYRCLLRRTDGQFELLLNHEGRVTRLHTCDTEQTARALAGVWRSELDPNAAR